MAASLPPDDADDLPFDQPQDDDADESYDPDAVAPPEAG